MTLPVLVIDLSEKWTTCHACGDCTEHRWGLAVDDTGAYVENDYSGEWGGVPACQRCHDVHAAGGVAGLETMLEENHGYTDIDRYGHMFHMVQTPYGWARVHVDP